MSKLHGKALSFNNVLDLDACRKLLADLEGPACVIVKHNNPCGVALGDSGLDAYERARDCDPISAYGGVIAINQVVDVPLAESLHKNFVEVLIAPGYEPAALEVLQQKENIRIFTDEASPQPDPKEKDIKRVRGGILVQDRDGEPEQREMMEVVTRDPALRAGLGTTCSSPGPSVGTSGRTRSCSPRTASPSGSVPAR